MGLSTFITLGETSVLRAASQVLLTSSTFLKSAWLYGYLETHFKAEYRSLTHKTTQENQNPSLSMKVPLRKINGKSAV